MLDTQVCDQHDCGAGGGDCAVLDRVDDKGVEHVSGTTECCSFSRSQKLVEGISKKTE